MIKASKAGVLLVIAFTACPVAQNKKQAPSKPRPTAEMQRLAKMLVGKWNVVEDYAPGGSMPHREKGTAQAVIRIGPGGFSLIEDFVATFQRAICTQFIGGTAPCMG